MSDWTIEQMCTEVGSKLLYIFDFLNMWTFYVEVMEINEPKAGESYLDSSILKVSCQEKEKTFNLKVMKI